MTTRGPKIPPRSALPCSPGHPEVTPKSWRFRTELLPSHMQWPKPAVATGSSLPARVTRPGRRCTASSIRSRTQTYSPACSINARGPAMIELSLAEVADAVGGVLHSCSGTEMVTGGVEFDSRRVQAGGLFVALPGERVDGHDFAAAAMAAGAAGVLAGRTVDAAAVLAPPVTGHRAGLGSGAYALAADTDGAGAAVLTALAALARSVVHTLS